MAAAQPPTLTEADFLEAEQRYLSLLPLEHFMEATAQATQRKITLESLDLVHARRPEVQVFNELLVQYPRDGEKRLGQVVPDNMVVVWHEPIKADGSFNTPFQPAKPLWVLEYVSKHSKRKDYEDNFEHYEKALAVTYYLIFYPETLDLTLYHHNGKKYVSVPPDQAGRHPIGELEIQVGLVDGWVRFWFRGELLPLPGEMQKELDDLKAQHALDQRRLAQEKLRADDAKRLADDEKRRADSLEFTLNKEREARSGMEKELAELRAQLAQSGNKPVI